MKKTFIPFVLILIILCLSGCNKNKRYQKKFDRIFDVNMEMCIKAITEDGGMSDEAASNTCSCMLRKAFEIDPAFVDMKPDELSIFMTENFSAFNECTKTYIEPVELPLPQAEE